MGKNILLKMSRFEGKLLDFYQDNGQLWLFIFITISSLLLRNDLRIYNSTDFLHFLEPWGKFLEQNGGFKGIATLDSDYNAAYLYILAFLTYLPASLLAKIKVVSFIFEYATAIIVMLIIRNIFILNKKSYLPYLGYGLVLFAPTLILNGAVWGQCDIIHTFFIVLSLYLLIKNKYTLSFISFGFALAFKLQAIFFLPVLVLFYIKERKFSGLNFLLIPLTIFVVFLPAWALGKPISDLFSVYFNQIGQYKSLVLNFSNIYSLIPDNYEYFHRSGIFISFAVLIGFYVLLSSTKIKLKPADYISIAMITVMICTFFLPSMHERYMFTADILAVLYFFLVPNQYFVPLLIWFINVNAYYPFLFQFGPIIDFRIMALVYLGLLVFLIMYTFKSKTIPQTSMEAG